MNRVEIEVKLNRDRSELLETLAKMSRDELYEPRTVSEHNPDNTWSFADHFVHTTLIEKNWNAMFRRHLSGGRGMVGFTGANGEAAKTMDEIMASVHAWTEEWAEENRGKPFDELVRIGLAVRSDTLALLAELDDEQLESKIPGAPWADGTVGGIMAANADHGRMHYAWAIDGTAGAAR